MKDDFDNFEIVQIKNETDLLSDSNTNSSTGLSGSVNSKKLGKANNGNAKIKLEGDEQSDSSECVSIMNKDLKKEENDDVQMGDDLQLKSEEVDIKDEDG